mmetsp:Transcript_71042/g.169534  ORF Transcript_71042/g.169534 Transcript_71042/m.169534 type:complete len:240 (+) Transcript_71042:1614-2333(+)
MACWHGWRRMSKVSVRHTRSCAKKSRVCWPRSCEPSIACRRPATTYRPGGMQNLSWRGRLRRRAPARKRAFRRASRCPQRMPSCEAIRSVLQTICRLCRALSISTTTCGRARSSSKSSRRNRRTPRLGRSSQSCPAPRRTSSCSRSGAIAVQRPRRLSGSCATKICASRLLCQLRGALISERASRSAIRRWTQRRRKTSPTSSSWRPNGRPCWRQSLRPRQRQSERWPPFAISPAARLP